MKRIFLIMIALGTLIWADIARYTRSDVGIVTDHQARLIWQDDYSENGGNVKSAKWTDGIHYCEILSLGDYTDWRLPNFNELYHLADRSRANPTIDPIFQHTASASYWSSTSIVDDKSGAWHVPFHIGYSTYNNKSSIRFVRCVRSGE